MTPALFAGLGLLLVAGAFLLLRHLPARQAGAVALFAVAAGLALARQVVLAVPLAGLALKLWRDGARMTPRPGGRSRGGERRAADDARPRDRRPRRRGDGGSVRRVDALGLSAEELQRLYESFEAEGDADSLALLHAWLDRAGRTRRRSRRRLGSR